MAAKAAPIKPGSVCEWAWLLQAGGGVVPIMGCPGRPASDRHHGPDKNTLNNNVGRTCTGFVIGVTISGTARMTPIMGPGQSVRTGQWMLLFRLPRLEAMLTMTLRRVLWMLTCTRRTVCAVKRRDVMGLIFRVLCCCLWRPSAQAKH